MNGARQPMQPIRPQVEQLLKLGPFPPSQGVDMGKIKAQQELLEAIKPPISDEEAKQLVNLFGPDDYYGLALDNASLD